MRPIFFTADWHFFHENVMKYCDRPFETVEQMNETIINNYNAKVPRNGHVYVLGDIGFAGPQKLGPLLEKLNGTKYLIRGNHDFKLKKVFLLKHFAWVKDLYELKFEHESIRHSIMLCHYAMRVWNKKHYGAWHLYGHSHGTLPEDKSLWTMDVGVDCNNFSPLSIDDVKEKCALKKIEGETIETIKEFKGAFKGDEDEI